MPTEHIIALLIAERDKLNLAIQALRGPGKKRGASARNTSAVGTRKRHPM